MLKRKILCFLFLGILLCLTGCDSSKSGDPTSTEPKVISIKDAMSNSPLQYPATNSLFYYNVYDDYVAITKYLGEEILVEHDGEITPPKTVKVPDMIDGLPVYVIGNEAFSGATFESIEISKNVVKIGEFAFYNCKNLRTVTFANVTDKSNRFETGEGVITLGDSAFEHCEALETIILPDSVEAIGASAFSGCLLLKQINVPQLITSIPEYFCSGCESLAKIYISDSVVEIADSAFDGVMHDAQIYGGVYSQSAHYAAEHFMLFVINREAKSPTDNAPSNNSDKTSEKTEE